MDRGRQMFPPLKWVVTFFVLESWHDKMENLAASADANASVLLEVRNKAEDTQRRLKAEKVRRTTQ